MNKPLLALLDSGATNSFINENVIPKGVIGTPTKEIQSQTLAGSFLSNKMISLQKVSLPEFLPNRIFNSFDVRIMNGNCRYDLILGRDNLSKLKINILFENNICEMEEVTVPMREYPTDSNHINMMEVELLEEDIVNDDNIIKMLSDVNISDKNSSTSTQQQDMFTQEILPTRYEAVDFDSIFQDCDYLSKTQQQQLIELMKKFPKLFDNILRSYPTKVHLEIDKTVPPKAVRPYTVPRTQLNLFHTELMKLVQRDVLEKGTRSEWIAGSFIIPKKNNEARWITDFRALNKAIIRKKYPLPKIQDILERRKRYKYVTKLDLSMCFYTYVLDDESKMYCTISTPFGLYRYKRLPQGTNQSPDIAQEELEKTLSGIPGVEAYIDDIAIFSEDWESHLATIEEVLRRLEMNGYSCNPRKCEWAVQETDFLGHYLTPEGIKPWSKKVRSILQLQKPTNIRELRKFLGMVNYYRYMWPSRSHILEPLTNLTGKTKFVWTETCTQAFEKMKSIIATDCLLIYPDHNEKFIIETDASDYQLGAVIKQKEKPVAFYSRKLTSAQKNYTTIEKELLSIVETLREFRSMLYGAEIHIYTDHQNLTHALTKFTTQRVLRWRVLLEEYGPTFHYKKGKDNILADALSRLPTTRVHRSIKPSDVTECQYADKLFVEHIKKYPTPSDLFFETPIFDQQNLFRKPFNPTDIQWYQQNDEPLKLRIQKDPSHYRQIILDGATIIVRLTDDQRLINNEYQYDNYIYPNQTDDSTNKFSSQNMGTGVNPVETPVAAMPEPKPMGTEVILDETPAAETPKPIKPITMGTEVILDETPVAEMPKPKSSKAKRKSPEKSKIPTRKSARKPKPKKLDQFSEIQKLETFSIPWKIALPDNMLTNLVSWHHRLTMHTEGANKLYSTLSLRFTHPKLKSTCNRICHNCQICKKVKIGQRQYGKLAPRQAPFLPWSEVHVDDIGPWTVKVNGINVEYFAMTMIDPVYNLLEICGRETKFSEESARLLKETWLCRYPRPFRCVNDNGSSFKKDFQAMLLEAGITPKQITPYTPTANSIIEATHKLCGQVIRTLQHLHPPTTKEEAKQLVSKAYATVIHSHRCSAQASLGGLSPGSVAFNRDMLLNLPLAIDIEMLHTYRQHKIDEALIRANNVRIPHDYKVGEKVFKKYYEEAKNKAKLIYKGPYEIIRVHTNNTVTLRISANSEERVSIRKLKPEHLHIRRIPE